MEEAEILCDRIIILDKGKIIAEGTKNALKKKTNIEEKITIETKLTKEELKQIESFKNVLNIKQEESTVIITYKKGQNNLKDIIEYLNNNKIKYNKIFSERPTLNDVFLELTGKDLRD